MKKVFFLLLILCAGKLSAQLANGSIAPDFTLNDINGNSHHLYEYLDQGKTVIIDCFATHCPGCWAYHNTNAVDNLYAMYGPNGTENQNVIVLAVEQDPQNGINEISGISGFTVGNWLAGTSYPIINPEGAERTQFISDFSVDYYPLIYAICPDRTVKVTGSATTAALYEQVQVCALTASTEDLSKASQVTFRYDTNTQNLKIFNATNIVNLKLTDSSGKLIMEAKLQQNANELLLPNLSSGVYFCTLVNGLNEVSSGRFVVE